jgi:predicted PolB exonuclease-like 3'-5' exonuclease
MRLFIDIETVPRYEDPENHPEFLELFKSKFKSELKEGVHWQEVYSLKAGLNAEFGKIVCVSIGYVVDGKITIKSFYDEDERPLLIAVSSALNKATSLVAHNGKEFDYPWLCRRMIVNGIKLPGILQIQNLKPWEIHLEDTVDLWRFGQFNHRASLACMCYLFGLPSPKSGMDGSQVAEVFYKEKDLEKIATYCEGDITALINVYRKMQYQETI